MLDPEKLEFSFNSFLKLSDYKGKVITALKKKGMVNTLLFTIVDLLII